METNIVEDFDMVDDFKKESENFLLDISNNFFESDVTIEEISSEDRKILIDKLIDDSQFLLGLSDNREDITHEMVEEVLLINNIDTNLLLKLYYNSYNFIYIL